MSPNALKAIDYACQTVTIAVVVWGLTAYHIRKIGKR